MAANYGDRRERAPNDRLAAIQSGTKNNLDRRKFLAQRRRWRGNREDRACRISARSGKCIRERWFAGNLR
jgi:hypothetical protein